MKVWLDDNRNPETRGFHGYTWYKCPRELIHDLDDIQDKVTEFHLDHYLNDWGNITGKEILFYIDSALDDGELKNLKTIYVHTSDEVIGETYLNVIDPRHDVIVEYKGLAW